jgi:hypothetical protein
MSRIIPLLLTLAVLPVMAEATEGSKSRALPAELVERLLGLHAPETELVVGAMPDRLKGLVPIPAGATVDATVRRPGHHMILLTMAGSSSSVRDALVRELVESGWSEPAERRGYGESGFISSAPRVEGFCKEGRHLHFNLGRARAGQVPASIVVTDSRTNPACSGADRPPGHDIELPRLYSPSGVRPLGTTGGGGRDHRSSTVELETDLALVDLIREYDSQFIEQGWTRRTNLESLGAVLSVYERTDEEGNDWIVVFTGVSTGDSHHQLSLRGFRPKGLLRPDR